MSIFLKDADNTRYSNIRYITGTIQDLNPGDSATEDRLPNSNNLSNGTISYLKGQGYAVGIGNKIHFFGEKGHYIWDMDDGAWELEADTPSAVTDYSNWTPLNLNDELYAWCDTNSSNAAGIYKWDWRTHKPVKMVSKPYNGINEHAQIVFVMNGAIHVVGSRDDHYDVVGPHEHYMITKDDIDDEEVDVDHKNWVQLNRTTYQDDPTQKDKGYVAVSELSNIAYIVFNHLLVKWIESTDEWITISENEFNLLPTYAYGMNRNAIFVIPTIENHDEIHIVGRVLSSETLGKCHYCYDGVSLKTVTDNLPVIFEDCCAVQIDDSIYILNVKTSSYDGKIDGIYKFMHNTESVFPAFETGWTASGYDLPSNVKSFLYHGNDLFAFANKKMYKSFGNSWDYVCDTPFKVEEGTPLSCNNKIYYVADYHESGYTSADRGLYEYSQSNNEWTKLIDLPDFGEIVVEIDHGARHVLATVLNGYIHVLYGTKHYRFASGWQLMSTLPITKGNNGFLLTDEYSEELILFYGTNWYICHFSSTVTWTRSSDSLPINFESGMAYIYDDMIHILIRHYHYVLSMNQWVLEDTLPWSYSDNGVDMYGDLEAYSAYGAYASSENSKAIVTELFANAAKIYGTVDNSTIFNRIKAAWVKIQVPVKDNNGNYHMEDRIKRVKNIWVGRNNNVPKKVY